MCISLFYYQTRIEVLAFYGFCVNLVFHEFTFNTNAQSMRCSYFLRIFIVVQDLVDDIERVIHRHIQESLDTLNSDVKKLSVTVNRCGQETQILVSNFGEFQLLAHLLFQLFRVSMCHRCVSNFFAPYCYTLFSCIS